MEAGQRSRTDRAHISPVALRSSCTGVRARASLFLRQLKSNLCSATSEDDGSRESGTIHAGEHRRRAAAGTTCTERASCALRSRSKYYGLTTHLFIESDARFCRGRKGEQGQRRVLRRKTAGHVENRRAKHVEEELIAQRRNDSVSQLRFQTAKK